jgi:hypothetical protein
MQEMGLRMRRDDTLLILHQRSGVALAMVSQDRHLFFFGSAQPGFSVRAWSRHTTDPKQALS